MPDMTEAETVAAIVKMIKDVRDDWQQFGMPDKGYAADYLISLIERGDWKPKGIEADDERG